MSGSRRVVVATSDPVTARMAGPAIRAWHLAEELSSDHEVHLATTSACDRHHERFAVSSVDDDALRRLEAWMDVLVFQGGLLRLHPFLRSSDKVIVADVYDPFHLENLEQTSGLPAAERVATVEHLTGVLDEQLARADFLTCATETQRDFWLGSLATLGRVNPETYDADPTLRSLIDVVPFGLPSAPPAPGPPALRGVVDGIGEGDRIVLWAGGVYNWFDPLTLLHAVDGLRRAMPEVRLVFMGMTHPNPAIPAMRMAVDARALADRLGLTGRHVFFNEGWVDYDERQRYLLEADVGVSTHLAHIETAYSFRTRILDYLWAGLPVVATGGDAFAPLIEGEGAGATVAPGDVDGLRSALGRLLGDAAAAAAAADGSRRLADRFCWPSVVGPLRDFCRDPRRAPDAFRRDAAGVSPGSLRPDGITVADEPGGSNALTKAAAAARRAARVARAARRAGP